MPSKKKEGKMDVSAMENLVGTLLANQLASVMRDARTDQPHP